MKVANLAQMISYWNMVHGAVADESLTYKALPFPVTGADDYNWLLKRSEMLCPPPPVTGTTTFFTNTTQALMPNTACMSGKVLNSFFGWRLAVQSTSNCGMNWTSTTGGDGRFQYLVGFETVTQLEFGSDDGSEFELQGLSWGVSTSSWTSKSMLFTGYKNGMAVPGATMVAVTPGGTGILNTQSVSFTGITAFGDVDNVVLTPVGTTTCNSILFFEDITVGPSIASCPVPSLSLTGSNSITCNGGTNGSATVSASGGTSFDYSWVPNVSTGDLASGLSAGVYTCYVQNECARTASLEVTISQPSALVTSTAITNVACNGGNNGVASISASGGTGGYSYLWSTGSSLQTITGLLAGVYTATVTDANSCKASKQAVVTQPTALVTSTAITNVACNGGSNGVASISASGGAGGYSYLWSTGSSLQTITGLLAGVYTATVTDVNSCKASKQAVITQPSALVTSTAVTNVTCNGGSNGVASISTSGGAGGYSYLWSTGSSLQTITGLLAGVYTATVTDANSCKAIKQAVVTQPSALVTPTAVTNVACNGGSNGVASISASGGAGGYSYLWSTGSSLQTITGLLAGVYTATVTDANSCKAIKQAVITQPSALVTSTAVTNVACNGGSNGVASISASGGAGGYSYLWSTGSSLQTITGLMAGVYTATVTDANSCTSLNQAIITQPTTLVTSTTVAHAICNGSAGSATITASGGAGAYTYLWSNGATTSVASGLLAGAYTATVTDANSCTSIKDATITQPSAIVTSTAVTNVACNGGSNGVASITASGGTGSYTYLWSNGATTSSISGLLAGAYTATVSDANSCTSSKNATVTQPSAIVTSTAVTNVACNGGSNGVASITASGGAGSYTYLWSNGVTTSSISGLLAGAYTATVTDANGCTSSKPATVTEPSALVTSTAVTNVSCYSGSTGSATVTATGGTAGYTYLWSTGSTTSVITGQPSGVYTSTVTDANGCSTTNTVTITQPASAVSTSTAATHVLCFSGSTGSATVTATGGTAGYTYLWSTGATTSVVTSQPAGVKTLTVTDANGCSTTNTVTITQPATAVSTSTAATSVLCFGGSTGSATVTATGGTAGYTYLWSTGATTSVVTSQPAGIKTLTVTDANGCAATNTLSITQPATALSASTAVSHVLCNSNSTGSATVTATGGTAGYTYLWSTGATTSVVTSQPAGVKTLTVTDANGCSTTNTLSITQPATALSTSTAVSHVLCFGGSTGSATVTATDGTAGYSYLWSTGATTSVVTNQPAGVKTLTVTDANGCRASNTVTITQPLAGLSATQTQTNITCVINGRAALSASGGTLPYTYSWSPSGGNAASSGTLTAGTYTCTLTDANSCTLASTFAITANTLSPLVAISGSTAICSGATATLSASGANTYTWSTGATSPSISLSPLATTLYTVTGTNSTNGCTTTATHTLNVNANPSLTITASPATVCTGQSSTLTATGALTYTWSTGSTGPVISSTPVGASTYTVTGTNAAGCSSNAIQQISLYPAPAISLSNIGSLSGSVCAGTSATLIATGASTYTWSTGSNSSGIVITPASATSYSVTGTDANGCAASASIAIGISANPTLTAVASSTGICQGFSSTLSVSGASTYVWTSMGTGPSITVSPVSTTVYTVTGTNSANCVSTATLSVTAYASPTVSIGADAEVAIDTDYPLTPTQSGALTYTWSPATYLSSTTDLNTIATPGSDITYILRVSSANGCTASDTVSIKVLTDLIIANYMSPNGDGQNDTWKVNVPGLIKHYSVTILDSYGKTVFSKDKDYNNEFDGKLGGEDLPDGVYYYFIKEGSSAKYKGSITLTK